MVVARMVKVVARMGKVVARMGGVGGLLLLVAEGG
jgi:hypothetical protein